MPNIIPLNHQEADHGTLLIEQFIQTKNKNP